MEREICLVAELCGAECRIQIPDPNSNWTFIKIRRNRQTNTLMAQTVDGLWNVVELKFLKNSTFVR